MATRTSHRWRHKPGNLDALHATRLFPADNDYGIPALEHTPVTRLPAWLVPYRQRVRANEPPDEGAVHFFAEDYRFETVWNRPVKALEALRPYRTVLTPDFSLYRDWPLALQLWNTYRNRWCGRFWQSQGLTVIPTVSWSTAESYDFCFLGVPRRGLVAIGTVGVKLDDPLAYQLFLDGFREMVRRLEPVTVLCYGRIPATCQELVEVVTYPTRWTSIRAARRAVRGKDGFRQSLNQGPSGSSTSLLNTGKESPDE
ncbi:MAG: DUF4417 domain-containing protein [Chloroflexi bacterium]|nr:DUF4417 domain-containing protein [Chloroflexota bacterium]MCI0731847.1 DUF4417 domain-containing protein [Chloroflexota bacterium]